MKTNVVVTAVARWFAATNESIIVNEWPLSRVKEFQYNQLSMDSWPEVLVLVLG
jgi:hypothetical protein